MRPLLISGRKFDLRCFVLVTLNRRTGLKGYFFHRAYARTSCRRFQTDNLSDREIHLTNDAVQKHAKSYGKFESGNKLDLDELQQAISRDYPDSPPNIVQEKIMPEIRRLTWLSLDAAVADGFADTCIDNSFELLGYDYMVDVDFRPTLIEVNSNPCLEFACPLLTSVISDVIEHTFRTAVDPLFPPPPVGVRTKACEDAVAELTREPSKFDLIYPAAASSL